MALSERERFKVAVLAVLAEHGVSLPEITKLAHRVNAQFHKSADWLWPIRAPFEAAVGGTKDVATTGIQKLMSPGLPLALVVAPAMVGAAGGYSAAKLTDVSEQDVDTLKQQELADIYRIYAERLRTPHGKPKMT